MTISLLPVKQMQERVNIARESSDTDLFLVLLYFGEMVTKLTVAGMVAALCDDRERHRYPQLYKLVRADGLGEWGSVLSDIITGTASQYLCDPAREEQRELASKNAPGTWQYEAVKLLHQCIQMLDPAYERLPAKENARRWFELFAVLRNKTRGHGATLSETNRRICVPLQSSINLLVENFRLFKRPWAYLHRNLSGRYWVIPLNEKNSEFTSLKGSEGASSKLPDGTYIYFDEPRRVELLFSINDARDFLFPNGSFTDKRFEVLSYISDYRATEESSPYLSPTTPLPESETQGLGLLGIQGNAFTNLPPIQKGYIPRPALEAELCTVINDDRHPVITLVGRGGIGKTWLTLNVLNRIADQDQFMMILWFSARDIDLLPQGPKLVTPHVLTPEDVAAEYVRLVQPKGKSSPGLDQKGFLANELGDAHIAKLLVLDNFETVRAPIELYKWLNSFVRLPNKVLITSRIREFKGDYPIEVRGMTEDEGEELIEATARQFLISGLLTEEYKRELYLESSGHPYVMKVLLGEIAKTQKLVKPERLVATREDILEALFERTYAGLTPGAQRVFLTLCAWRTAIPQLALEAVLLRSSEERLEVDVAVEELIRSSFIETLSSETDGELFLTVPMVSARFGGRKLATSPMKSAIEVDLPLLRAFGPAQQSDISRGVPSSIEQLFKYIAARSAQSDNYLEEHLEMLEFIARRYPPAWLQISRLFEEKGGPSNHEAAKEPVRRYLEAAEQYEPRVKEAWKRLVWLCQTTNDYVGEVNALVELCQLPGIDFYTVTNSVNRVNNLFKDSSFKADSEEKRVVSRRLAEVMEVRISEGNAGDCSRLAWLYIRLQNMPKAIEVTRRGLKLEPDNYHCQNLMRIFEKEGWI